jgi:thiosulfate reductase/polysulfide reductase chain A
MNGRICPRGVAGKALVEDRERPQTPLIRQGERGVGKWRQASWDEALYYVAERLSGLMDKHGPETLGFSDRGGPFRDFHRAFLRGLGTPNYCNHDSSCARNVHHAHQSLTGLGRKDVIYDLEKANHVVLQGRNLFESIDVQEVSALSSAMDKGCRLTVIDIRANVSANKADRFFMVRPKTDYAFNLAVIHELLRTGQYDPEFAERHIRDLDKLRTFVEGYTVEWAAKETGVRAQDIRDFVSELASAAPSVIWHPGWMTARYDNSFFICRSIYIINALLGAYGARGGLPLANSPGDVGQKGLNKFMDLYQKPTAKRADGVGWQYPHFEEGPGMAHLLYEAMETGDPYPVTAYIAYRHDPLMAYPEPERLKKIFSNLDLLVSVTFSWSDTAWYSDVVLPLSPYLERESIIATKSVLQPFFFVRQRAVEPTFDTRADWEIISGLAKRLNLPELAYDSIEDIWEFQLRGTGVSIEDFKETGMVPLASQEVYKDELRFKTPSGSIEIFSEKLEEQGFPSLKPYESPAKAQSNRFRLTFGRCALHTQGHTVNNPYLNERLPENVLWINAGEAKRLDIADNELVQVSSNGYSERIRAKPTEMIHPEAVFMLHGFGHTLPVETRAYGKGAADNKFMPGGLRNWDPVGGGLALQEHYVEVSKIA